MSLDRQKGQIVFECDGCGDAAETDVGDFAEALESVKHDGWRAVKIGDLWCHYCPRCKDKV